jgi:hypothetical protein
MGLLKRNGNASEEYRRIERHGSINGEHPQNRKEWSKKFEGLWLVEFFGILRFAQDDSRNKNKGKG